MKKEKEKKSKQTAALQQYCQKRNKMITSDRYVTKIQRNLTNLTFVATFVISIKKICHLLKIFIRCERLEEENQVRY